MLRSLSRDCVTLQISLDSPTPERHDRHWGQATWTRALAGIERARGEGFRVRLAATVSTDEEAEEFRRFLDAQQIAEQDRVIRHIALRGFATEGIALAPADLVPEVTITAEGIYWHPVGAEDADFLVRREIFPLAESFTAVRRAFDQEREHAHRLASIFNCDLWRAAVPPTLPTKATCPSFALPPSRLRKRPPEKPLSQRRLT